jgi:ABC-type glycerol-3-phosphate transport system substrate-binding protein
MNRKLLTIIAILLLLTIFVAACGPTEEPAEPVQEEEVAEEPAEEEVAEEPAEEEPAEPEPVTVKFWHVWGGARLEMIEAMIADFQALYPHITVEHTLLDQTDMVQKYLTAVASGDPPDVIMVHGANFFQSFADQGALMSLDDYIAADGMVLEDSSTRLIWTHIYMMGPSMVFPWLQALVCTYSTSMATCLRPLD